MFGYGDEKEYQGLGKLWAAAGPVVAWPITAVLVLLKLRGKRQPSLPIAIARPRR